MTSDPSAGGTSRDRSRLVGGLMVSLILLVVVPIVLVLLAGIFFSFRSWMGNRRAIVAIQQQKSRLLALGEPLSHQELQASQQLADGAADATPLWTAALASFDESEFSTAGNGLPFVGQADEAQLRPEATGSLQRSGESFLHDHRAIREAVMTAAAHPGQCRFAVAFAQGPNAELPGHLSRLRCISRFLMLDMQTRALRGDSAGAVESLEALFAVSESLAGQVTLTEQAVRMAILSVGLDQTKWLLNECDLDDGQLARLQHRLENVDPQEGLRRGMLGERAQGLQSFQKQQIASQEAVLIYLEAMTKFVDASRQPFPTALAEARKVERELKASMHTLDPFQRSKYLLTLQASPWHTMAFERCGWQIAHLNLLQAAISAERFRLREGAYPTSLDQLPTIPLDPFAGGPAKLIVASGELTFYSVGPNGVDDGGKESPPPNTLDLAVPLRAQKRTPPPAPSQ